MYSFFKNFTITRVSCVPPFVQLAGQEALDNPATNDIVKSMVEAFQSGEGPPLLLVSLKAGGTGLNLTAASQVIHYDRWWNPAVEDQATDRAWRLGQQRTVNVHKLVCQGTVEERIGEVIDEKRAIADAVAEVARVGSRTIVHCHVGIR